MNDTLKWLAEMALAESGESRAWFVDSLQQRRYALSELKRRYINSYDTLTLGEQHSVLTDIADE